MPDTGDTARVWPSAVEQAQGSLSSPGASTATASRHAERIREAHRIMLRGGGVPCGPGYDTALITSVARHINGLGPDPDPEWTRAYAEVDAALATEWRERHGFEGDDS